MAHSLQRLTLYGLLSGIETDLRSIIAGDLLASMDISQLLSGDLKIKLEERSKRDDPNANLDGQRLLSFTDLGDTIQLLKSKMPLLNDGLRSHLKAHLPAVERLIPIRNRVMHNRPLEFDDFLNTSETTKALARAEVQVWQNTSDMRRLASENETYFASLVIPDTEEEERKVSHNLPPPEFDDTGFIGRVDDIRNLKRAIFSSHPVITVIGEGGLGKTALTMRVCYDLISDVERFDAIVWTSAKAARLTVTEIKHIEGAITTSLGLIERAARFFEMSDAQDPLESLIYHLENNKVLLVIDNLETVVDDSLRALAERVPHGSKLVFTSRIPLGAYDRPVQIRPLSANDAASFFRESARVWAVHDFVQMNSETISEYCAKLKSNPLFIKWFIQGVRAGQRPSVLLTNAELLLQFCLQNVFAYLSSDAKFVLRTLSCLVGSHTISSLSFYTDFGSLRLQPVIVVLQTCNLITVERSLGTSSEEKYLVSPLAREFIKQSLSPSIDEQRRITRKRNELDSAREEYEAGMSIDIFDINNISIRNSEDFVVAKMLKEVLQSVRLKRFTEAEATLERALQLAPSYFEVKRVEGFLRLMQEDYFRARSCYENALSLHPNHPPLRLWFSGLLTKYLNDFQTAEIHLAEAYKMAPTAATVALEYARVLQILRKLDQADTVLANIENPTQLNPKLRFKHFDVCIGVRIRRAEVALNAGHFSVCLETLEAIKQTVETAGEAEIDGIAELNIKKISRQLGPLFRAYKSTDDQTRVSRLYTWIAEPIKRTQTASTVMHPSAHQQSSANLPNSGQIHKILPGFGFIETTDGLAFFGRHSWEGSIAYELIMPGLKVTFTPIINQERFQAEGVAEEMAVAARDEATIGSFQVALLDQFRGKFGFLRSGKQRFYFNCRDWRGAVAIDSIALGTPIRFIAMDGTPNQIAKDLRLASEGAQVAIGEPNVAPVSSSEDSASEGFVTGVLRKRGDIYGFIESDGRSLFFHKTYWLGRGPFLEIAVGVALRCRVVESARGLVAKDVKYADQMIMPAEEGEQEINIDGQPRRYGILRAVSRLHADIEYKDRSFRFFRQDWTGRLDFLYLGEGCVVQFEADGEEARRVGPLQVNVPEDISDGLEVGFVRRVSKDKLFIQSNTGEFYTWENEAAAQSLTGEVVEFAVLDKKETTAVQVRKLGGPIISNPRW